MKLPLALATVYLTAHANAGAAMFASMCYNMAGASNSYELWTWDGGIQKDWRNFGVKKDQVCKFDGIMNNPSCTNHGYKGVIHNVGEGCNNQDKITEGTITTPKGEVVDFAKDNRCKWIETCDSGLGGCSVNGVQCDI